MNNKNLRNIAFSRMFLFNDTSNDSKEEVTWKTTRPAEDVESEGNEPVPPAENPPPPNLSEHPETQSIPSGEISSIPNSHNFPVQPRGNVEKEREYARQLQYQDAYEKYNPQHKINTGFTKDELASLGDDSKVDSYISEKYPTATNEQRAALRSIALQQRLSLERDSRSTSTTGLPRNLTDTAESGRRFVESFVNATPRISSETQSSPRLNTSSLPRVTSSHFTPNTAQAQTPVQENSVNPYGSSSPVLNDKSTIAYFKGTKFNPSDFSFKTRKNNNGKIELLLDNDTLNGSKERREAILSAYNQLYSGKAVRDDNGNMWRLDAKGNIKQIVTRVEKPAVNETKIEFDIPKIDFQGIRFDQDGNLKGFKEGWFKDDYQKQLSTVWNELRSGKVVEDLSGRKYKLDPKTNQVLFLNPSIDQQQPNITDVVENGVTPSLPSALGVTGTPTRMTNAQVQGEPSTVEETPAAPTPSNETVSVSSPNNWTHNPYKPKDFDPSRIENENFRNAYMYAFKDGSLDKNVANLLYSKDENIKKASKEHLISIRFPGKTSSTLTPEEHKQFESEIKFLSDNLDYRNYTDNNDNIYNPEYDKLRIDQENKNLSEWRETQLSEAVKNGATQEQIKAIEDEYQRHYFDINRGKVLSEAIKASERTTYNLAKEMWPQGEEDLSQWWGRLSDDQKNGLLIGGGLGLLGFLMMAGKEDKDAFDWILTLGIPVVGIGGGAMYGSSKGAKPGVVDPRRLTQYMEKKGLNHNYYFK